MKRVFLYPLIILAATIVALIIVFSRGTLTVANNTPYDITFAYSYSPNPYDTKVKGWFDLKPGQKKEIKHFYRGDSPSFSVHAQSTRPELLRWIYELPISNPGIMYFEGEEDSKTFEIKNVDFEYNTSELIDKGDSTFELAGFALANTPSKKSAIHVINDGSFDVFLGLENMDKKKIDSTLTLAPILSASLERQHRFTQKYKNPIKDFPFHLGIGLDDFNGYQVPGIAVTSVNYELTIDGAKMPIQVGDIILAFEKTPVFSQYDLSYFLGLHGNSIEKGINIPIELAVLRGKNILKIQTTYFFNEEFYGYTKEDKNRAVSMGVADTFTWGTAPKTIPIAKNIAKGIGNLLISLGDALDDDGKKSKRFRYGNTKLESWKYAQDELRLKQMYSNDFKAGGILGMFISPGQAFTKTAAKSMIKKGMSKRIAYVASAVSIELAEGVIWTINDSSPILSTTEKLENVKRIIPEAIGIGIVSGSLIKSTKSKK